MSDNKPRAIYQPGELEATRKNLGNISPEEAKRIANLLGGEVGVEKSRSAQQINRNSKPYAKDGMKIAEGSGATPKRTFNVNRPNREVQRALKEGDKNKNVLPSISQKEKSKFDKLMASSDHKIKRPQNFFNFLLSIGKTPDRVSQEFIAVRLVNDLGHMQKFFSAVKTMIDDADMDYRIKVQEYQISKFKFLRFCDSYNLTRVRNIHKELSEEPDNVTVADMVPFIKEIYKPLIKIFYIGEANVVKYIRETYDEICGDSKIRKAKLHSKVREASTEWVYVYNQIIKGLYPLLMRMISPEVLTFGKFFNKYGSKILEFLEITKFDLILPDTENDSVKKEEERIRALKQEKKNQEEQSKKPAVEREVVEEVETEGVVIPENVKQALGALEMLFPEAGWMKLGQGTDLYPYFQPIYKFSEGFNLLCENNPMQVTIVLLRILEDLFQGCRNIKFTDEKDISDMKYKDSISDIFNDWSGYIEEIFEREYIPIMKDLANHLSTQLDFIKTPYARKQIASMLWLTKITFHPYLTYEFFFMEKKNMNMSYLPLPHRVEFLKNNWSSLIAKIELEKAKAKKEGKEVNVSFVGSENIMESYIFAVPNNVSRRLDALYGFKNRTNLTLLKYTLSVIIVLDWWISDKNSPAYMLDAGIPYRVSSKDKSIVFSVPTRSDQNALFNKVVRQRQAAIQQARAQQQAAVQQSAAAQSST